MRTIATDRSRELVLASSLLLFALACGDGPSAPEHFAITPANQTIEVARSLQLSTRGGQHTGTIAWESSDGAVATVSASGLVTALFPGSVTITAMNARAAATVRLTVTATRIEVGPSTATVALGGTQLLTATVVDADGAVISGVPVSWSAGNTRIATVDASTGLVAGIAPGSTTITVTGGGTSGVATVHVNQTFGEPLVWSLIDSGGNHACGLEAPTGIAYCWGDNHQGALGAGDVDGTDFPVLVSGARRFSSLSVGYYATCGIDAHSQFAYCWGANTHGDLGDDTFATRWEPTPVATGIRFTAISASGTLTCGVEAQTALGYCWGKGGLIGDGTLSQRSIPALVGNGTPRFRSISAGAFHACGIELHTGLAYCWGRNSSGQLGDGTTTDRFVPTLVAGGNQRFSRIDADHLTTCGIEMETDLAYCWGQNSHGQLGDGTTTDRQVPTRVSGSYRFTGIDAGELSCGIEAQTSVGYCWGRNILEPTRVGGGSPRFSSIIADNGHACGVAVETGLGYCWDAALLPALVPRPIVAASPGF